MKDNNLLQRFGKENPFKTPEDYFENFTSTIMDNLPEKKTVTFKQESVTMWTKLKPLLYLTAMFVGAALIIRVAMQERKPATDEITTAETDMETIPDEMLDVMVDHAMLDDYSLYVYLSDVSNLE